MGATRLCDGLGATRFSDGLGRHESLGQDYLVRYIWKTKICLGQDESLEFYKKTAKYVLSFFKILKQHFSNKKT
jgi:hypothetical protein